MVLTPAFSIARRLARTFFIYTYVAMPVQRNRYQIYGPSNYLIYQSSSPSNTKEIIMNDMYGPGENHYNEKTKPAKVTKGDT